jgi:hypothetical protein
MTGFGPALAPTNLTGEQHLTLILVALALLVLGLLPALPNLGPLLYPPRHPRRTELDAEIQRLPYAQRLLWTPQLLALGVREGGAAWAELVRTRLRARRERRRNGTRVLVDAVEHDALEHGEGGEGTR